MVLFSSVDFIVFLLSFSGFLVSFFPILLCSTMLTHQSKKCNDNSYINNDITNETILGLKKLCSNPLIFKFMKWQNNIQIIFKNDIQYYNNITLLILSTILTILSTILTIWIIIIIDIDNPFNSCGTNPFFTWGIIFFLLFAGHCTTPSNYSRNRQKTERRSNL